MEISFKIHANCSEWDQEVFSDDDMWRPMINREERERIAEEARKKEWDK